MTKIYSMVCAALACAACTDPAVVSTDAGRAVDVPVDMASIDVPVAPEDVDRCDPRLRVADGGSPFNIADGCALPNLVPRISRVQIQTRSFTSGSCEVMEGCTRAGRRRLLRFDLQTPNIGQGDLYLGPPTMGSRPNGPFEYSTCHMHYHFLGYADYRLCDTTGCDVALGHKQSFCLEDFGPYAEDNHVPLSQWYHCSNQGIHAGSFDLYERTLDCQYIDITDTPPGHYRIRARINEMHTIAETSYADNEQMLDVDIPATDPVSTEVNPTDVCVGDMTGAARDCSWSVDRTVSCTAGEMVTLGCNAACAPPLGDCVGSPIMRVCAGDGPCTHALAVAELNDACGTTCQRLMFRCPSSPARYTVLTAASRAGAPYTCHVVLAGH